MRAIVLLGPTASGKTACSLQLAQSLPIEIISVDSALVYRGMDIGSAKPDAAQRALCPHHLIDIREISEPYSAADFRTDALLKIEQVHARGHFPVIVGGTMLYAKALREGMDTMPAGDAQQRLQIEQRAQRMGWTALHEELRRVDPATAARLAPGDTQRIGRALEVYAITGRPLSCFQQGPRQPDASLYTVGLLPSDRARLHRSIEQRLDAMMQAGFVQEVEQLMARPDFDPDLPAMRCVGYRQVIAYLQGQTGCEQMLESARAATRQLAKRQMTWLRSMPGVHLVDSSSVAPQTLVGQLLQVIEKEGI